MTSKQEATLKAGIAGVVAGGIAFAAASTVFRHRSHRRMSAAKALKMVGTLMDSL